MPAVKHEPANTKQINYPGGKNGMWKSECSAKDYVARPSDTAKEAEDRVRQHAAAKANNAEYLQVLQDDDDTSVEITTEIAGGKFEMFVEKKDPRADGPQYVTAVMDYDQLWEHVHNCLDALERMGKSK